MVFGSCTDEVAFNVSSSRLWKGAVCEPHILYPKLMPNFFSKAERIGEGVGAINVFYFAPGIKKLSLKENEKFTLIAILFYAHKNAAANMPLGSCNKNKIDVMNERAYTFKNTAIEGGLIGVLLKSLTYESVFVPSGANSCIAKIKMEYETLGDRPLSEEELKPVRDGSIGVLKAVEAYLLANLNVYA